MKYRGKLETRANDRSKLPSFLGLFTEFFYIPVVPMIPRGASISPKNSKSGCTPNDAFDTHQDDKWLLLIPNGEESVDLKEKNGTKQSGATTSSFPSSSLSFFSPHTTILTSPQILTMVSIVQSHTFVPRVVRIHTKSHHRKSSTNSAHNLQDRSPVKDKADCVAVVRTEFPFRALATPDYWSQQIIKSTLSPFPSRSSVSKRPTSQPQVVPQVVFFFS